MFTIMLAILIQPPQSTLREAEKPAPAKQLACPCACGCATGKPCSCGKPKATVKHDSTVPRTWTAPVITKYPAYLPTPPAGYSWVAVRCFGRDVGCEYHCVPAPVAEQPVAPAGVYPPYRGRWR